MSVRVAAVFLLGLCVGCSGPSTKEEEVPEKPLRGSFETVEELRAYLDENGEVYGWSEDAKTFGFCSFSCESREDAIDVVCYATSSPQQRVQRTDINTWLDHALFTAQPTGVKVQTGDDWHCLDPDSTAIMLGEQNITASMWSGGGTCGWEVLVDHNREAPYANEENAPGDCFNSTEPALVMAPNAQSVGYALVFPGDHGCNGYDGGIVAP